MTDPITRQRLTRAKRKAAGFCTCREEKRGLCDGCKAIDRGARKAVEPRKQARPDRVRTFAEYERLCERGED
jgi:hypothetical protein